jgi:hypothetical protein
VFFRFAPLEDPLTPELVIVVFFSVITPLSQSAEFVKLTACYGDMIAFGPPAKVT